MPLQAGRLRLSADLVGSAFHAEHAVEDDQLEKNPDGTLRAVQARRHILDVSLLDLNLATGLGLSDSTEVALRLPVRGIFVNATFEDENGDELKSYESIHHRDETLTGVGDLELWLNQRLLQDAGALLTLRAGVAVPTGNTEENPFELGRMGKRHQHIFFGTGTFDPLVGFQAVLPFGDEAPWSAMTWAVARFPFYATSEGYQAGIRAAGGLGLLTPKLADDWMVLVGPEVYHEEPSTWSNGRESINSGRTDLIATAGVIFTPGSNQNLTLLVKKPFTLRAEGGQLEIPLAIVLSYARTFQLWGEAGEEDHGHGHGGHDHGDHEGHDHGDHGHEGHDHAPPPLARHPGPVPAGGDVEDLATGGESFSLARAAMPEKRLVVIDFWAEWCEPCHTIDAALKQLAAHHPELAVRRVEIEDDDSPAAKQHLGGGDFTLPIIWILDGNGKRLKTLEGTSPAAVVQAIEDLLHR